MSAGAISGSMGNVRQAGQAQGLALWDQIPMLMSRTTQTLFTEDVENPQGMLTDRRITFRRRCRPTPASPSHPSSIAMRVEFNTESRRYIAGAAVRVHRDAGAHLKSRCSTPTAQGTLPYGGSFGHSSLVEMPAPINHR